MIFGKNRDKGIRLNGLKLEVVDLNDGKFTEKDLLVHDEQSDPMLTYLLARMRHPEFPEPIGVFRSISAPIFDVEVRAQTQSAIDKRGRGDLQKLFESSDTWKVQ